MTNIQSTEIIKALKESEYAYFAAGSQNSSTFSGTMSVTPEHELLASGTILYDIQTDHIKSDIDEWLNDVEKEFKRVNAGVCRFYLPLRHHIEEKRLIDRGYQKVIEVGLATSMYDDLNMPDHSIGRLMAIENDAQWDIKKKLYQLAILGPDGHDMQNGSFAQLEKLKCDTGYMTSYIYWKDDQAIGTVSLAISNNFARLKNLLVHPHYRNQGVGWEIVLHLMYEAKKKGAKYFGAYAVEKKHSHQLYLRCGLKEMLQHIEWSKELG